MMQRNIKESGFSLIELLVSVAIIVLLAAIAIPEFKEYRKRIHDAVALSGLKSMISMQHAYYADNEIFYQCADTNNLFGNPTSDLPRCSDFLNLNDSVVINVRAFTGYRYDYDSSSLKPETSFGVIACSSKGTNYQETRNRPLIPGVPQAGSVPYEANFPTQYYYYSRYSDVTTINQWQSLCQHK